MKIQSIEAAVRKQLPFRKEQHFLMRTDVGKDALMDAGLMLICGLSSVYVEPRSTVKDVAKKLYDITLPDFKKYAGLYFMHIKRACTVIESYGVDIKAPDFYKVFAKKFWHIHNEGCMTDPYTTGVMLSHVLSSRREYNIFLKDHVSHLTEDDFTSFFIFIKAQLTINYIKLKTGKMKVEKYVDLKDLGY